MKKLISTKMKVFMMSLLIISIACFTSSMILLYRSDFKLSDYFDTWGHNQWNFGWQTNYYNNYDTTLLDIPLTDIKNLNMDFTGYDVILEVHSGSNLIINGNITPSSDSLISTTNNDGTLTVSPSNASRNLLVKLPSNYTNNLDFKFTEGSVNLSDITLESLNIKGVNSDVYIDNVTLTSGNISETNGEITLNNLSSKDLSVNTLNGEIYSTNLKGNINLSTVSGDIFASLTNEITNSQINTTDGDISLEIPDDNNFSIDFNTINGELNDYSNSSRFTKYDIKRNNRNSKITIGTGSVPVSVTTVDGDLNF